MINPRSFEQISTSLTNQAIEDLLEIESTLSGEDSTLTNCWEEICAQMQWEQSVDWDAYVATMNAVLEGLFDELPDEEKATLARETESGSEYGDNEMVPIVLDEIVNMLRTDYLLEEARNWTNDRVKAHLQSTAAAD